MNESIPIPFYGRMSKLWPIERSVHGEMDKYSGNKRGLGTKVQNQM